MHAVLLRGDEAHPRRQEARRANCTNNLKTTSKPCLLHIHTYNRYDDNGGTALAVAGADYCIVAASTRMSTGYSIMTRRSSKILAL